MFRLVAPTRPALRGIRKWSAISIRQHRFYQTGAPGPQGPAMPYGPGIAPPLKGVKVLDLTRVLAGPTATMLLADLGADVIKVEEVTRGDDTRTLDSASRARMSTNAQGLSGSWLPPVAPTQPSAPKEAEHLPAESAYFLAVNRNKRSITVNFKTPEGLEIVHRLVRQADVLVENFVSGKLASMGLGYEDCKKINPKLVYASITGMFPFNSTGRNDRKE